MFIMTSTLNGIVQLVSVILIFIFVLALSYFAARIAGTYQSNINKQGNIQVIETYRLANNKYIQIVKLADCYIAIGVGKDNVEFLTQLNKDAIKEPQTSIKPLRFQDVLAQIKVGKHDDEKK